MPVRLVMKFVPFKTAWLWYGEKFSISRTQPKRTDFIELPFLFPEDQEGKFITSNNYENCADYVRDLWLAYRTRWSKIKEWLEALPDRGDMVLCCRCPHTKLAKKQLEEIDKFICHSAVVSKIVETYRPDIWVVVDKPEKHYILSKSFVSICSQILNQIPF